MTFQPTSATGPDAGSNAGRGFRYQDLIGSLFVTRMYLGETGFAAIVPEGSDDYEIHSDNSVILVDTKSNRAKARLRSEGDDKASFQKLWTRPLKPDVQISEYWLVTERSRSDKFIAGKCTARELFSQDVTAHAEISFVLIEPDPLQTATELLVAQRGLTPLAAELVVIAFARVVGELASANGPRNLEQREAITPGEAEHIAARVLAAVDAGKLEALLRSGFVSTIDFHTPLEDSGFYLGVDVQPGHFAAGLALERPNEAARVVEALNRNNAVVIRGPSGAGKSSLMWNAVLAAIETRRWFRVNTNVAAEPTALTAFLQAYSSVAIGFVVDDIGRGGIEAWTALRQHCSTHARAIMIGSIRSEDVALLPARHTISEIETKADGQLARVLWGKLHERGQTQWPGWSEPWELSQGLLLEYGHILTAGAQLGKVILDQIRTRLEQKRDHELAILCASALAAAHGGTVSITTLRHQLNLNAGDTARALERLIAEHLVRVEASGAKLSGLHSLRAASISSALAEIGYSALLEQAMTAIAVTDAASLEKVISGLVTSNAISDEAAANAAAARLAGKVILSEVASAVRGLRTAALTLAVRDWLATLSAAGIPRKLATTSAMFGLNNLTTTPDIGKFRQVVACGNQLHTAVATQRIPASLASALIVGLRESANQTGAADVVDALSALARAPLTLEQRSELSDLQLTFELFRITDIVRILDAAESIDPTIASAWARRAKHINLLHRLAAETPFALPVTSEEIDDGLVVHGDIYEAIVQPSKNANDLLVGHVNSIMRLEPRATLAHVRLVDNKGEKSLLHLDSEKRMPRKNAPPEAMIQSNRRVIDIVAAEVACESWSHYLLLGEQLLKRGLPALQRLLDSVTVGRVNERALDALNEVVTACDNLIAPDAPPGGSTDEATALSGRHLTPLQNLVFSSNAELVKRFAQLPDGAAALAAYVKDLIKQADDAKQEPWALVVGRAPEELDQLQRVLRGIELIALESAASGVSPLQRWPKADRKPKDAFVLLARRSREAFLKRIETRRSNLLKLVIRELPSADLIGPAHTDGLIWRTRFVATFRLTTFIEFKRWIDEAKVIGERLRSMVEEGEDVVFVPLLNGHAAVDYSYQLSRGDQSSSVASMLISVGQSNLLVAPDQSVIEKLSVPVVRHPIEVEHVFTALRDFCSMHQLGLGGPERPSVEREWAELAFSTFVKNAPRLLEAFSGVEHPSIDGLKKLFELVLSGAESETIDISISSDSIQAALAELTWHRAQPPH